MKTKLVGFIVSLMIVLCVFSLVGCDFELRLPELPDIPDYNADIEAVLPEDIDTEHFVIDENATYYTSSGFYLSVEVNGSFMVMDYFTIDGDKRVYDNLYLYTDDYFYMVSSDYKYLYASLSDSADLEYAEEEKQSGEDIQINIKKSGVYKLTFDVKTHKFDLEYKAEIETPVYYTIENCNIYTVATEWVQMSENPDNSDEFVITNFNIEANGIISFYNNVHVSNYKVTLEDAINNKFASARKTAVTVNVGGVYDIYINRKTYVVRLELTNPDTATYSCVYYDGLDFIALEPYEQDVPYIFRDRIVVTEKYDTYLPKYHTEKYRTYDLAVVDEAELLYNNGSSYCFRQTGTYDVIINLKTFEVTVELLPE